MVHVHIFWDHVTFEGFPKTCLHCFLSKKAGEASEEALEGCYIHFTCILGQKRGNMSMRRPPETGMVSKLKPLIFFPLLICCDQRGGGLVMFWGVTLQERCTDLYGLDNGTQTVSYRDEILASIVRTYAVFCPACPSRGWTLSFPSNYVASFHF